MFFKMFFVFLVIFVLFPYLPSKITYEISNFAIFGFFVFYGFFGICSPTFNILELQGRLQKRTFFLSLEGSRRFLGQRANEPLGVRRPAEVSRGSVGQ